ncbi:MAG: rhomboid family intramembrane serine protease [Flavobacteriales bacterium]
MLNNLPQVTKNIILLNIMFFIATIVLQTQGIDLTQTLGAHYVNSPLFQPYQIVTHFFMHGGFLHILFNMYLFAILGAYLEHIWGPKRFFIFYFASAIGAFVLYNILGVYELAQLKSEIISQGGNISEINQYIKDGQMGSNNLLLHYYIQMCRTPMVGASGAIFGVMTAFAILFPNTEFRLYFAIPIKAKYFVAGYFLIEVYAALQNNPNDSTAHLAHVGGAIVGAIIVLFWRRTDRSNFW